MLNIPYEIILNISVFIYDQQDLYDFLEAINKIDYFDEISKFVFLHYVKKLKKYYKHIKNKDKYMKPEQDENDIEFNLNHYLYDIVNKKNIECNDNYDSYDDVPYDDTNTFTSLCSEMIKEYQITKYNGKNKDYENFIISIRSLIE
jgi:hypothetical protein